MSALTSAIAAESPKATPASPVKSASTNALTIFENTLGMRFVRVPSTDVWFSIWETRVQDFAEFVKETRRVWTMPPFAQTPAHPAVNVSWEDALAFCRWLTGRDKDAGLISGTAKYRLPTDEEWSLAVGLAAEDGSTPEDSFKNYIVWPWGVRWPPAAGAGNFGPELKVDNFPETAPVGSFRSNRFGLFDLGGNVWEWCDDWYSLARVTKTLRGSSWMESQPATLLASYRFHGTMNLSNDDIGFRVVLVGK